jgi:hypothetical protein
VAFCFFAAAAAAAATDALLSEFLVLSVSECALRWSAVAATCLAVAPSSAPGSRLPTAPFDYLAKKRGLPLSRKNVRDEEE